MVFGFDDAVGGGAFAGDVPVVERWGIRTSNGWEKQKRGWGEEGEVYKSTSSPFSFSMVE